MEANVRLVQLVVLQHLDLPLKQVERIIAAGSLSQLVVELVEAADHTRANATSLRLLVDEVEVSWLFLTLAQLVFQLDCQAVRLANE